MGVNVSSTCMLHVLCLAGGMPPDPQGRLRRDLGMEWPSAKQNKRFLLLFLEKEEYH
jgi:hypothetical protein